MTADFHFYEDDDPAAPHLAPAEPTLLDEIIEDTTDPNRIVTKAPAEHFRLGLLDVACLVINRMIGRSTYSKAYCRVAPDKFKALVSSTVLRP